MNFKGAKSPRASFRRAAARSRCASVNSSRSGRRPRCSRSSRRSDCLRQYGGMYDDATCVGVERDSRWVIVGSKDLTARGVQREPRRGVRAADAGGTQGAARARRVRGRRRRRLLHRLQGRRGVRVAPGGGGGGTARRRFGASVRKRRASRRQRPSAVAHAREALFPPAREVDVRGLPPRAPACCAPGSATACSPCTGCPRTRSSTSRR